MYSIYALSSMPTLLSPFLKEVSAKVFDIGDQDNIGLRLIPRTRENPTHAEKQSYSSK